MYAGARERVVVLLDELPAEDLHRPIPATPSWTVKDLAAHLAGVTADILDGRLDGVATDTWTDRQVAERKDPGLST